MVNPAKALGRLLLGSLFVTGGLNQLKDPTYGAAKTDELKERYGLAGLPESSALVKANGAAMIAGGVTLALSISRGRRRPSWPRCSSRRPSPSTPSGRSTIPSAPSPSGTTSSPTSPSPAGC